MANQPLRYFALFLPIFIFNACAVQKIPEPSPDYRGSLVCRIVSVEAGPQKLILPIVDVNLDALSDNFADQTFEATLHDNRKLAASIRPVKVNLPRDRFNIAMTLDGNILLRANHLDLDIYIEITIDERVYALHCFPELTAGE